MKDMETSGDRRCMAKANTSTKRTLVVSTAPDLPYTEP